MYEKLFLEIRNSFMMNRLTLILIKIAILGQIYSRQIRQIRVLFRIILIYFFLLLYLRKKKQFAKIFAQKFAIFFHKTNSVVFCNKYIDLYLYQFFARWKKNSQYISHILTKILAIKSTTPPLFNICTSSFRSCGDCFIIYGYQIRNLCNFLPWNNEFSNPS